MGKMFRWMDGWVNGWLDIWIDVKWMDVGMNWCKMDGCRNELMNEYMQERINVWIKGWMD